MDKRTHLIERAAARLEVFGPQSPVAGAVVRKMDLGAAVGAPLRPTSARAAESEPVTKPRIGSRALIEAGLIASGVPHDRVGEEFRIIQGKIVRQGFGPNGTGATIPDNLVMITSSGKGDGKSFCAINLAAEVARQGDRRVLLVDADPKPDGLAGRLAASGEMGLLDLARDKRAGLAALTLLTDTENLDFLPFGKNGQGSAELFASRRMAETIIEIGRSDPHRLVIFDAPPCLASSTPHTLASLVGQVVLVVAAGRTQRTDIEAALELVQACPNVSLLLNKVPTWLAHSFGSYSFPASGN